MHVNIMLGSEMIVSSFWAHLSLAVKWCYCQHTNSHKHWLSDTKRMGILHFHDSNIRVHVCISCFLCYESIKFDKQRVSEMPQKYSAWEIHSLMVPKNKLSKNIVCRVENFSDKFKIFGPANKEIERTKWNMLSSNARYRTMQKLLTYSNVGHISES